MHPILEGHAPDLLLTTSDSEPIRVRSASLIIIGRSSDCAVRLLHPSVSRRHAWLVGRRGLWLLADLGSKNGTWLNARPLIPHRPEPIHPGDTIRLARCDLRVDLAESSRPTTTELEPIA